jgi:hypothetical protein
MSRSENKMRGALNVLRSYVTGLADIASSGLSAAASVDFDGPAFAPLQESSATGGGLSGLIESMSDPMLFPNPAALVANGASMDSFVSMLDKYAYVMDTVTTNFAQDRLNQFSERATAIVQKITQVRDIIAGIGTIPLDATIDALGENMRVANTSLSVAGGAVNINVQLNVTMNAEKMAANLVVGGYVRPTQEFENYVKTNDGVGEHFNNPATGYLYGTAGYHATGLNAVSNT